MPNLIWLISLVLLAAASGGQNDILSGLVRDSNANGIAGALVLARDAGNRNVVASTRTSATGAYHLPGLRPGDYAISVEAAGFNPGIRQVHVGSLAASIDFELAKIAAATSKPKLEASGVRGAIDPGGYSAPAQAAATSGLKSGMDDLRGTGNRVTLPEDCAPVLRADQNPAEENLFGVGYQLMVAGSTKEAADAFRRARKELPRSVKIWIGSGAAEFLAGDVTEAIEDLLHAAELDPLSSRTFAFLDKVSANSASQADRVQAVFKHYAELAPGRADALYYYAVSLVRLRSGQFAAIENLLNRAVALDPGFANAHFQLAALYGSRSDYASAVREYEKTVQLAPGMAEAHYRLALAYRQTGRTDLADAQLRLFKSLHDARQPKITIDEFGPGSDQLPPKPSRYCPEAIGQKPDTGEFTKHLQAGIDETGRGDLSSAMGDLQLAMRVNSSAPEVHYRMGLLLGRTGDFRAAEAEFRRAIELQPKFAEAYYNLGLTLIADPQSKLNWTEAIEAFRKALQFRPNYSEAANYLAAGLLATGDAAAAVPELELAVRWKPDFAEAHFNLGLALEELQRSDEAEKEYKLAEKWRGSYPEAAVALGNLQLRRNDNAEAIQQLSIALRANPDLIDAHYALARALHDKKDEAGIEFDQVKELTARKAGAIQSARLSNEGLEAAAKGDIPGAAKLEQQAVDAKPDYGVAHLNLGLILADTGDWKRAEQELIKAASLLPGKAEPWFELGRVMQRQGDPEGARVMFGWAAHLAPADKHVAQSASVSQPALGAQADTASATFLSLTG